MANESTTWLYEQLTNKGYNVGKDVNEFDSLMHANAQSRQWAYETATNCGFNVGKDIDEFTSLVAGTPQQQRQNVASTVNAAPAPTSDVAADAVATEAAPTRPRYYKLRRGGRDFTVPEEEVEAAGGLTAWWNKAVEDGKAGQPMGMNLNAPYRVYMHGNDFDGHVAMSVAEARRQAGYDFTFTDEPMDRKPTRTDRDRVAGQLTNVADHNEKVMDDSKEWMEDMQEYSESSTLAPKPVESHLELDPETGEVERTYLTHGGRRGHVKDKKAHYGDDKAEWENLKDKAEWEELKYRLAIADSDMSLAGQIRRAQVELSRLQSQAQRRVASLGQKAGESNNGGLFSTYGQAVATEQTIRNDNELRAIEVAIRQRGEQLKDLYEERDRQKGKDVGFWRGFGRKVGDIRSWDFGLGDVGDAVTMLNADYYTSDDATEGEKAAGNAMMKAVYDHQQTQQTYGENASFRNRAGMMTGQMLPFMVDFILTGGGFEAINVAGRAATKGATKLIGREALKEMADMGVKAYVKQYGARGAGRVAGNWTIKALGTTADELLIRAPLMTNTVQAGKTASDIIDRKLGDVTVDEYGNYDFTNDKTWGSAVWQGEANAIIENYSEMFGTHLEGIMPALAKTFGGKRISGMLARANASSFGQILGTTRKHFQRMGVSDYFGEVSEEYYGQLWRTMLNLDDAKNGSGENLFLDGQFHGDIWGGMALSMGLLGSGKYTMATVSYAKMKHEVNKADRVASEILTPEVWEPMRHMIDNTHNDNMGELAEHIVNSNYTQAEREAAMNYMELSLYMRGNNLAETAKSRGAEQDPAEAQLNSSYMDGYNIEVPEEMADAQNMYTRQRLKAEERFGLRGALAIAQNPVEAISQMRESDEFTEEDVDLALDFANARILRDGMMQRINDDIDEQIAQSDAKIDASINDKSGSIITVVKKSNDTPLYVVSGQINTAQNADSTWEIDVKNSDKDIVVRNSVTGELEFTTPKELYLRDMDDPERVKAAAAEAIRQQTAQSAADAMNGVRYYNVGDVVPIEYYGDNIEAKVHSFLPDGGIIVEHPEGALIKYSREDLQEFAHNADMSRVEEFERARQEERSAAREPQAAPQQKPKPQFKLNDEFTIAYQGQPVRGSITGELDEEGKIEIYTEEPTINGQQVIRITPEELKMILESYNGEDLTEPSSEGAGEGGYGADNWRDSRPDDNYGYQRRADIATDRLIEAARQGDEEAAAILGEYREEIGTPGVYRFARKEEVDTLQRGKHYAGRNGDGKVDVTASDVPTSAASGEYRIKFKPDFDLYKVGNGRTRMKNAEEKDGWIMDGYDIADVESIEQLQPDGTYAEVWHADAQAESAATLSPAPPQAPARSRVPVDEQGQPKYDDVDPDTAWDAIVEEAEGDEAIAAEVVADILEDRKAELTAADKALTKAKEGKPEKRKASDPQPTMADRIAAKRAAKESLDQAQAARDRAQAAVDRWTKIAESKQRRANERLNAEQAEARRRAEALAHEEARLRAEREEQARKEREALNGVPDWQLDTPADARARGYRRDGAKKVDRPEVMDNYAWGNRVQVKFGDGVIPEGYAVVIEAEQLQPSHLDGKRNPSHFLDEAQPKNRKDGASRAAADRIAREIRPEEITSSVTAFTGAPSINGRGEVIQGNNRGDALRRMYEGYPQSAEKYRQYLIDHAQDFGLTPESISAFSHPVLVNMLDVTDDEAIHYGQYAAQDTESGGIERIKPKNAVQKMGNEVSTFASLLLRSADDEASFSQLVDDNGVEALKWMSRKGFISDTQYASAFDSNGNLSAEAANDLKSIMYQSIFSGGSTRLEETFNKMPAKAQRAILATAFRDNESPKGERLLGELQQSVTAFGSLMGFEQFRDATNPEAVAQAIAAWKRQTSFDDVSGEAYLPAEKFSDLAIALAALYKSATQKQIQSTFNSIYNLVQGTVESDLFGEADSTKHPLSEAVQRVLGIEYQPKAKPTAEQVVENQPNAEAEMPEEVNVNAQSMIGRSLTEQEATELIAKMESVAEVAQEIELTIENWDAEFGEDGIVETPIGKVKMGENQFTKLMRQGRNTKLGMVKPTLVNPDIIVEDSSNAKEGMPTERESSYVFVKAFIKQDGSRYYYFTSVTVSKDGHEVVISNQEKRRNVLTNLLRKGKLVWKHADDVSTASDIADGLYSEQREMSDSAFEGTDAPQTNNSANRVDTVRTLPASASSPAANEKGQGHSDNQRPSARKVSDSATEKQGIGQKSSIDQSDKHSEVEDDSSDTSEDDETEAEATRQYQYRFAKRNKEYDNLTPKQLREKIKQFEEEVEDWLSSGNYALVSEAHGKEGIIRYLKELLAQKSKRAPRKNSSEGNPNNASTNAKSTVKAVADAQPLSLEDMLGSVKEEPTAPSTQAEHKADRTTPLMDKIAIGERLDYFPGILDKLCDELAISPETVSEFGPSDEIYEAIGHSKEEIDAMSAEELEKLVPDVVQQIESGWRQALQELKDRIEQTSNADEKEQFEQQQDTIKQHADTVIAVFVATLANLYGQKTAAEKSHENSRSAADDASGTTTNPSGNRLVTDERYAQLRERMRKKLGGQLNMGVDPEILAIGAEMAVYHIEKGARKFKAYASAMIADLGDAIRPYLKAFYNAVRDMPEAVEAGLVADMDSYDDVRKVDIANFDKTATDAMATAAAVVAEQKVEKEKEQAEASLKESRKKKASNDGSRNASNTSLSATFNDTTPKYSGEVTLKDGRKVVITYVTRTGYVIPGISSTRGLLEYHGQTQDGKLVTFTEDDVMDEPQQGANLIGDSEAYQEKEAQTTALVDEIGKAIESRANALLLTPESTKPLTMADIKKMALKHSALNGISDTDLQELVELAMTQLTRKEGLAGIGGTAEAQRTAYDQIVRLYRAQPNLNARDSERLIKQQYSTPTPFGYVMGQFVRAGGKTVGSMLEPSAGNGALTITVEPSLVHVNDIDQARLANLRKLGYGQVTARDALLPFGGDLVDVVMTNPPFGTVTERIYDDVFRISSLEAQMAINALEQMKDDGRAAIIIGGNTNYRTNGSMNPKDAAFFGYLYSHYNVADVINISGKALYSRNGTGYDVRMILIDGRKTGAFQRVYPPVKAKARAEQITTFDELYKRVQDDIHQIQQVGNQSSHVQREAGRTADKVGGTAVRGGNDTTDSGQRRKPVQTNQMGDGGRNSSRDELGSGELSSVAEGRVPGRPGNDRRTRGLDNEQRRDGAGSDDVQKSKSSESRQGELNFGLGNDGGRSVGDGRAETAVRPDTRRGRLAVKTGLGDEKIEYVSQSGNGFTLMSVVPAAQARVLQKSLGEIGDVDQYLVDELGYSSKDELYGYLAAEQIDSVALAIHQMNKGNAFIIGDMTGVGKGRQGAALIRYAVAHDKVPIYFTQKPTLFTDNYRDLADIGSGDLRPFIIASDDKEHSAYIKDAQGNVIHKLPTKKERERVYAYIMEHGTLPEEYDYVLTTYSQIQNGNKDYEATDGGWVTRPKKYKSGSSETAQDRTGQQRRDILAKLSQGNIAILDESHTVGGDSGCGRYMQMLTAQADGVTFMSATFAKRADNMPIYAQRTAIAEAGVKASELIEAIAKGGVTLQEIMSKQLVESGQMIRRERSFEGVAIDWLSVDEATNNRQRAQFDEVAEIFNAIRNFQDEYVTPAVELRNETAAERGATVGHKKGTKDMGVKNVPFASKMYNLVNQLLFALKVDAVADRVIENLRNGFKPVISFANTMEGFLEEAPKGVAMDEAPTFALTLMRALDGVMRLSEKDADGKTKDMGLISLNELSAEGREAYNAIRQQIMRMSSGLPISPMDAIRMKIEAEGYTVGEITGREIRLNRTEDGRYVIENRKDKDSNRSMRDFNSGKLDVLMINKSGSTGISLHASSKFEDQRPRVMVFAQFQSDINDEVQMRGRIDRSGQVTRGRYEYIMSTIPAEQRIQMMFKAKLKSLDANTTSSQKSKFNEMEIVDYLNKYGDEVVWEYMKEHPELEERLGDPLDMLEENQADDSPRTSQKADTAKKVGCAGKISRYLAFLSVEEQDEIFREITEAYRVKIQLLDDAGENDLEITTMPLRAETKSKKIWNSGVNPDSGNAFADNTYVEEAEVDVLKKPMKRQEIAEAVRKYMGEHYSEVNGVVDWARYADAKGREIAQFYQAKADEAVSKLRQAGEARTAKAREKAVSEAVKARGRGQNNFTDEEIQSLADTVANEARNNEEQKQRKRRDEILGVGNRIVSLLGRLRAGNIYVVPQDLKQGTAEMFSQTFGTFLGFKFNKGYTLGSSTAVFATLDGRRKVELALSDPAINVIISATQIAYRYSPKEIGAITMDNWDSHVPTQSRQTRYIITGNLLQALVDTEKGDKTRGNLISYSTIDGETRQGILMGENFKPTDLRNSVPMSSRLAQIREGQTVVSENGDVQIKKVSFGWQHHGQYELRVPKSKQRGGVYTMHADLLALVEDNNFITKGNGMVAYVYEANIARVVDMLSRAPFNLTVLQESKLTDVSAEDTEENILFRPVTDQETLDRLNSEPTIKVYRAMQIIDGGLRPPMSAKVDGQLRPATEIGVWEEAEERPEMADESGHFKLDKGNGKSIRAAYNPYLHTSRSPINDQFSSAWNRPELVTVEVEIPASELSSDYHADKAKDSVGEKTWKSGPIGRALAKIGQARKVILSRWGRVLRIVPVEEVADAYAQRLKAHGIAVPFNTVPPNLRDALAARGVKIGPPEKGNAGDASMPSFERWLEEQERMRMSDGHGPYTDMELADADDIYAKIFGKSRYSKKQKIEYAARKRRNMATAAQEVAEALHLDNVEIVTDASALEGKRAKAKGFYNKQTGKITIVIPNHQDAFDVKKTVFHEAVAHYGLRKLFGKHFDTFLDKVYERADEEIRRKIASLAAKNGWDFRTATEEYLASLAEDTGFADRVNARFMPDWWMKVKELFIQMLNKLGIHAFDNESLVLTDNELRYILWRSYRNLEEPGGHRSIIGVAEDVAMQSKLKVGNYAETGVEAASVAEDADIANTTSFNNQLTRYISGVMPEQEIINLGNPQGVMRLFLPELPIVMRQRILSKANATKHNVDLKALADLPHNISNPIFVFQRDAKTIGVLTEIKDRDGKNVCVAIELKRTIQNGGAFLEVNDIRSIHGREVENIVLPILHNNTLRYANKEKGLAWLSSASYNYQQEITVQDLDSVAKIVNNFENPTVEDDELFRLGDFTPRDRAIARDYYNRMTSTGGYQFQEAVQDSMLGLKKLYKAIIGGTRIEDVADFENAYTFENRMSSATKGQQHEYFIRYMQPLLREIGEIAGADKAKRRSLINYLMAKHGLERNEYMRRQAAENNENTDRDFAGLTGLTRTDNWQLAEETAQDWVDQYEAEHDTEPLWRAIRRATEASLQKIYFSGLLSKENYEKILGMYQYYIPLRGWDETTSDEVYGYLTSKDGPLGGSIVKKAKGRESVADDPIATIAMMADDAIRQGNRNIMKQRFLNFVLNHPSDLVSVHDLWLQFDEPSGEWQPIFPDINENDTPDDVDEKIAAFEERMEALRAENPDKYKRGRETQNVPYKVVKGHLKEHQVLIKRNGRTYVATINGNPRAAQALNGLTNPDVDQNGVVGNMLKLGTWVNRQLSAFYTTRNPDFVASNFFRDMLYSNCMTWVKESPRYALRFHKNFGRVNPITMRRLLGKWESGTLRDDDRLEHLFHMFMMNGGETGYTDVRDIEGHKRAIAAELRKQGSMGRRVWTALGMQLDLLNRSAENCARFAAFITSIEFGRTVGRAVYDAKEISVNFNKKGSGGKMVNAVGQTKLGKFGAYLGGSGRILFVFWNAGIQGMTNFGRQAKRHPAKFTAGATALFVLGYLMPILAKMLSGDDGDDDDKNAYYNLPEYIRRQNICLYAGEQWITIPLPIEFRAMYGLGELAHGVISGDEHYSNEELAFQMAAQVSQIVPLDMLEGGGGVTPYIPSAAKPVTEAYIMNRDWTGLPVYKDTPFNKNDPEWTKAYASADTHLVDFARWLNEISGGDDYKKGAIDINPAKIEHVLSSTFGGVISFPNKLNKTGETIFGDREFEWRNIPIANRLVKSGDERTANRKLKNEYYKLVG